MGCPFSVLRTNRNENETNLPDPAFVNLWQDADALDFRVFNVGLTGRGTG